MTREKTEYHSKLKCFIYEPKEDSEKPKEERKFRYVLGYKKREATKHQYLVCIGVNPRLADDKELDKTTYIVEQTALKNGCSGWIMFNLSPQIAENVKDLIKQKDFMKDNDFKKAFKENIKHIQDELSKYSKKILYIWFAWGTQINEKDYLLESFDKIYQIISKPEFDHLKDKCRYALEAHPHHPSRLQKEFSLDPFLIDEYYEKYAKQISKNA